jgi:hypothetical protein
MRPLVNKSCIFCVVLVFFCPAGTAPGRVIYVDDDATGANNGSSWQDAYDYLQDALADANSADKPVEIRVAQGIYKPNQGAGITPGDRTATFQLINSATLRGGYAGFREPDPNVRDIKLYETILSGDLDGNDVNVDDPCDLLTEPTRAENSYHVVTGNRTDETAVLDGFTIAAGRAFERRPSGPLDVVENNWGGGMINIGGSPTLAHCSFNNNAAFGGGGGVCNTVGTYVGADISPTLTNCTLVGNSAGFAGGGVYNGSHCSATLTNCMFNRNWAWCGGGMCEASRSELVNCIFSNNLATRSGGGMCNDVSRPMVIGCTFSENVAAAGGGMSNGYSSPVLINCTFSGNLAKQGGGMEIWSSSVTGTFALDNCLFAGNLAEDKGGGMYNRHKSSLQLSNCTFAGNSAPKGAALAYDFSEGFSKPYPSNLQVTNCILWKGGNEVWNNDGSAITIIYSDVHGGQAGVYDPCNGLVWGCGNIDADPCFADANNGDYHLKSEAGRWEPSENSKF